MTIPAIWSNEAWWPQDEQRQQEQRPPQQTSQAQGPWPAQEPWAAQQTVQPWEQWQPQSVLDACQPASAPPAEWSPWWTEPQQWVPGHDQQVPFAGTMLSYVPAYPVPTYPVPTYQVPTDETPGYPMPALELEAAPAPELGFDLGLETDLDLELEPEAGADLERWLEYTPEEFLPKLVDEAEPVKVSVDNNRCHIYGICQQEAPEVFRISEGGSLHYTGTVPAEFAAQARQAVRCCPMQAIAIRGGSLPGPARRSRGAAASRDGYRRIVVAGGGLAGLSAASRLRERGFDGELVLVGEEARRPYSRPPLSKQFLAGELVEDDLTFRADESLDAQWLLGTHLLGLDTERRTLELRGGERLPYDGLVIATGVDARRLPETPVVSDRVRTVRTVADAVAVQQAMQEARAHHVVVLGGGFVGCELACTAREHGMDVTLVVHSAPLLRRVLGGKLGEVVGRIQARAGVDVRLSTQISEWTDTGAGLRLRLDDGEVIDADFVVLGLGSVPRTEWLGGSGLDISDGVLCDETCHAVDLTGRPIPGVVAAGDVARWPNLRFDATPRRVEHLIHAVEMGQHAADALLQGPAQAAIFTPVPRFWSEQHGRRLQAVGMPALGDRMEIVEGSLRSENFVAAYHRDTPQGSQLVAAVAFDMPRQLLGYRDRIGRTERPDRTRPLTRSSAPAVRRRR
ncbi:NADPH-dependent 2,4-dienoyl-CoA reductase/sulfur reductase-like enzyme/ferredoxin [Kitasatospora sp. GAS204A]|uniref:FAD-dependent oxidoreductase n=1 Tax=unclassified Kitasatospora TaxID=2633591 RepID=UPI002474B78C|nr:FAD-dependent oxidoreductase [Kitasatospora sp. GAS204B]MDH6118889.1 NADPH-dependent 2,4-dienoyl-CoA reductase/sulfur reductase-like enzyme/ferredoxin [Kitasatospora sp. GAS204B]